MEDNLTSAHPLSYTTDGSRVDLEKREIDESDELINLKCTFCKVRNFYFYQTIYRYILSKNIPKKSLILPF